MHNISPTSPVLGDPLQLFPAQPRLRDVCLKVTPSGVFRSPPLWLALGIPLKACLVMLVDKKGLAKTMEGVGLCTNTKKKEIPEYAQTIGQ